MNGMLMQNILGEKRREEKIQIHPCIDGLTLVPLSRHISERIEIDRSTSGMSQPGVLVLRTSAAT